MCFAPQKPVQDRTKKQFMDVPNDVVNAVRWLQQDPVQVCTEEQVVDDCRQQTQEEVLAQTLGKFMEEQMVDDPSSRWQDIVKVLQIRDDFTEEQFV